MRSKKRDYIPFAEREVVYGTHEPIIEQNRWDNVQKILQSRPPVIGESASGYDNIFRGIIKCDDCGSAMLAKVEQKRKRSNVIDKTFYCCTKYRKYGKRGCSSHNIEARTVHEVVLADIQKHAQQALTDRKAMVTDIAERLNLQLSADKEQQKEELRQCKQRVSEIENLYAKLCEDMTRELITEKRFQMLSARYDNEQEELTARIKELEKSAIEDREQLSSIEQFAKQISGYAGVKYLGCGQIEQVICGGENYDGARPCDFEWVKGLRRECEVHNITFCFIETGTNFIKDGRRYYLPKKAVQSRMAFKSGMSYAGKGMEFRLTDGFGMEIPPGELYVPHYGRNCEECGSRLICNGCSDCGKCR